MSASVRRFARAAVNAASGHGSRGRAVNGLPITVLESRRFRNIEETFAKTPITIPSSGTAVYPHMPILRVASALDESASARDTLMIKPPYELHTRTYPILGLWGNF